MSMSLMWVLVAITGVVFVVLLGALVVLLRKQRSSASPPRKAARPLEAPRAPKPPSSTPPPASGPRPLKSTAGAGRDQAEGAPPPMRRVEPRPTNRVPPKQTIADTLAFEESRSAPPSTAAPTFENKTIKINRPPQDRTVKLLPSRFVVEDGLDDVKELRFFMDATKPITRITFGRNPGPVYSHIQLKPRTVSSRQATVTVDRAGNYRLINHAPDTSNPTVHNGRELGVDEDVSLTDGDRITMGEVQFCFQAD